MVLYNVNLNLLIHDYINNLTSLEHRLQTNAKTTVEEAPSNIAEKFATFFNGDGKISGTILGTDNLILYESCPSCSKKWGDSFDDKICGHCGKNIEDLPKTKDFRLELCVQEEAEEDVDMARFFCFRKHLSINTSDMEETSWKEEVEKMLVNLAYKKVTIIYDDPKDGDDVTLKRANSILLEEETENEKEEKEHDNEEKEKESLGEEE